MFEARFINFREIYSFLGNYRYLLDITNASAIFQLAEEKLLISLK